MCTVDIQSFHIMLSSYNFVIFSHYIRVLLYHVTVCVGVPQLINVGDDCPLNERRRDGTLAYVAK